VTVIGLVSADQADCPLPATLVRDRGEDKNKNWMYLKKSVVRAANITFMQHKAIDFLKEVSAKERAEALQAASAAVSIATVTTMTTVLTSVATPSVQSQQAISSVVTDVAAASTPLMAGQIFRDLLVSTRSKRLQLHESIKKIASHIAHKYTMNSRAKDRIYFAPFNGGTRQEWSRAIKTKREPHPDMCSAIRNAQVALLTLVWVMKMLLCAMNF
jgi:hypothetical protein